MEPNKCIHYLKIYENIYLNFFMILKKFNGFSKIKPPQGQVCPLVFDDVKRLNLNYILLEQINFLNFLFPIFLEIVKQLNLKGKYNIYNKIMQAKTSL